MASFIQFKRGRRYKLYIGFSIFSPPPNKINLSINESKHRLGILPPPSPPTPPTKKKKQTLRGTNLSLALRGTRRPPPPPAHGLPLLLCPPAHSQNTSIRSPRARATQAHPRNATLVAPNASSGSRPTNSAADTAARRTSARAVPQYVRVRAESLGTALAPVRADLGFVRLQRSVGTNKRGNKQGGVGVRGGVRISHASGERPFTTRPRDRLCWFGWSVPRFFTSVTPLPKYTHTRTHTLRFFRVQYCIPGVNYYPFEATPKGNTCRRGIVRICSKNERLCWFG